VTTNTSRFVDLKEEFPFEIILFILKFTFISLNRLLMRRLIVSADREISEVSLTASGPETIFALFCR
jgi:hypothetical protein